ncbi:MAG: hypothetical protein RLW87_01245 [Alphaproteobacteria bacterium]
MPQIIESSGPMSAVRRIRMEAERRIARGILVNGVAFRADDASTQRVGELLQSFRDGLIGPEGARFRTASGIDLILHSVDAARRIHEAQRRYRAACLASSAALQETRPDDVASDRHWPSPEQVDL